MVALTKSVWSESFLGIVSPSECCRAQRYLGFNFGCAIRYTVNGHYPRFVRQRNCSCRVMRARLETCFMEGVLNLFRHHSMIKKSSKSMKFEFFTLGKNESSECTTGKTCSGSAIMPDAPNPYQNQPLPKLLGCYLMFCLMLLRK